jgi:hypothetical protein
MMFLRQKAFCNPRAGRRRGSRPWAAALFLIGMLPGAVMSAKYRIPDDPYSLLTEIPSFYTLFKQKGLNAYSAEAKIIGPISKSLQDLAEQKKLASPEFIEFYTREKGFIFRLKNITYPPFFRQIINEMFTPIQAFDHVINLVESKRDIGWFEKFRSNTGVQSLWIQYLNKPHIKLTFTAKAGRCIETFTETIGEVSKTVKTLSMTFIIAPRGNLIKMLRIVQREKVMDRETDVEKKFTFSYKKIRSKVMPDELLIEKNGEKEIKFTANYTLKGGFIVFSEKIFGYRNTDNSIATIRIVLDNYKFNKAVDLKRLEDTLSSPLFLEKESMAEKEFARAKDHILSGNTRAAKKILKKIIKKYPKTTYAEQAKTLLNGLPD